MRVQNIKEKINTLYKNTSLLTKIRTILISITVLVLVAVLLTLSLFYNRSYSDRMRTQTGQNTLNAVKTINVNAGNINQRFVSILGSEEFATKCKQLISGNSGVGVTDFQDFLNDLNNSNYLISASLLITEKENTIIYSYQTMPRLPLIDLFDKTELIGVRGISCLSSRSNPFSPSVSVLPVVVPLRIINDYLQINKSEANNDLYIVLLLDEEKLRTAISLSGSQTDMEDYYLLNASGNVLNSDALNSELISEISTWISEVQNGQLSNITLSWRNCYVTLSDLYLPGYCIIGVSKPVSFLSTLGSFSRPILSTLILILFIAILLSVILTNTVTRPLSKLLNVVHKIEANQYTEKVSFNTNDEVGQLMNAINIMNDTIHQQMDQIREDEKIKYKTELKLLTEQINPHFLYNTLEEIQAEVLRHDSQTASDMIQNLAVYLRIGLSGGSDLIPISNEIQHASAYINIMNRRFGQTILFMYQIEPSLADHMILKTILQPLIENSIRHGFGIDAQAAPIPVPTIEVQISKADGYLIVNVSDNGSGFDEEATKKIMVAESPSEAHKHVGIHNVYQRLITFYGKDAISVKLSSIPYYQNTIELHIRESLN